MPVSDFMKKVNPCAVPRKDQPEGAQKPILPFLQTRSDKVVPTHASGAPNSLTRLSEEERIKRYMDAAATVADKHHSGAAQCLRASTPFCTALVWIILKVGPIYYWFYRKAYWFYTWAPKNVLQMCFGLALCFFGGTFAAAIAAVEAWRQMGWQRSYRDVSIVYAQMRLVYDANEKDDMLDEDGNGIVDVDEIAPSDLAKRKLTLAMRTVEEPDKLQTAMGSLWAAYLAVLATLRLQFARVAAMALGIAEMVSPPLLKMFSPPLQEALGSDLKHWVPTLITTVINIIAIGFAWYIQKVISAFYSGLRGGTMFANALFAFLEDRGWLAKMPCEGVFKTPYLNEAVGYPVAAVGFYTQLRYGFTLPFPLNLILLPLTIVQWLIEYQIVMGSGAPIGAVG